MNQLNDDPRISELRTLRAQASAGGGAERLARQHAKGKLGARELLETLLDAGSFHELEPFITHQGDELGLGSEKYLGDGVVTGYGQIDGRTVYVYAQDFTIFGGTLSEMQAHKICRVMDLAVRNGVPHIGLVDSGGPPLPGGVKARGGELSLVVMGVTIPRLGGAEALLFIRAIAPERVLFSHGEALEGPDVLDRLLTALDQRFGPS